MKRRVALWLSVAALVAVAGGVRSTPVRGAAKGTFTKRTYPAEAGRGPRDYWTYVPSRTTAGPRPMLVYLHGCTQTATDAATGTRLNDIAEERGFVLVYPEQRVYPSQTDFSDGNGARCWNWFHPDHQVRDKGEPATIAGITRKVATEQRVDRDRTYVMGVSAGADLATIMGATYPDLYAAIGVLAGCAYLTCTDATGAAAHRAMGPRARPMPVFIVQGTADPLNNTGMGATALAQWIGTNDFADDGQRNGSVSPVPNSVDTTENFTPGTPGDPCIRNNNWPCPGGLLGWRQYPYTVMFHGMFGCSKLIETIVVHGLSHNYPGGDPKGTFTDPTGQNIGVPIYNFFLRHRLGRPCASERGGG